jgi:hypothetical protein
MVNAKSNEKTLDGVGEDPSGYAHHPEIDCYGQYVACVYTKETQTWDSERGDWVENIRIAISIDYGVNFNIREWVSSNSNVYQDYADVQLVNDEYYDCVRLVVVWQERSAQGEEPWVIKARERQGLTQYDSWGGVSTLSDDEVYCIYPKVALFSCVNTAPQPDEYFTYWHFTWQAYDTEVGYWGIQMISNRISDGMSGWQSNAQWIAQPTESIEYRHPAISANSGSSYSSDVHLIYEKEDDEAEIPYSYPLQIIEENGHVPSSGTITYTQDGSDYSLEWASGYLGYPDIVSYGYDNTARILSIYYCGSANSSIRVKSSVNGGGSFTSSTSPLSGNDCDFSLRCLAIDCRSGSFSIVWTNGNEVYFNECSFSTSPPYTYSWGSNEQWIDNDDEEDFVDIGMDGSTYSHVCWQKLEQSVKYARDP